MDSQSIPTSSNNDISNPSTVDVRRRLRLGEVLVKEGIISEAQVESALAAQKQSKGKRLGEVLVDMRLVDEATIVKTLAKDLTFLS